MSPPNPKARLWLNEELPSDPEEWKADAVEHHDTWWNDWADWIASRSGARCAPPSMGTSTYPILGDAPGTYVTS